VRGLHLIELFAVVAIDGMVALLAMPQLAATKPAHLDLAAQEVTNAPRLAAPRPYTAQAHNVLIDHDSSQITYVRSPTGTWSSSGQ
jgi:Tfp pilus assembly protein FimT